MKPTTYKNNPFLAGKIASQPMLFGEFNRYSVYAVHTRFANVQWFVSDAHFLDEQNLPKVIRQDDCFESVIKGLV